MGCYINIQGEDKEDWLEKNGTFLECSPAAPHWNEIAQDELPICLVFNNTFTAAAIAFSEEEFNVFSRVDDFRLKAWFTAKIKDLYKISDLKKWLRK